MVAPAQFKYENSPLHQQEADEISPQWIFHSTFLIIHVFHLASPLNQPRSQLAHAYGEHEKYLDAPSKTKEKHFKRKKDYDFVDKLTNTYIEHLFSNLRTLVKGPVSILQQHPLQFVKPFPKNIYCFKTSQLSSYPFPKPESCFLVIIRRNVRKSLWYIFGNCPGGEYFNLQLRYETCQKNSFSASLAYRDLS